MIELNSQLFEELDLTYWRLKKYDQKEKVHFSISREENELLRKILLAKGVTLTDQMVEVKNNGKVIVEINQHRLIFDDVTANDSNDVTYLAKISDMLNSTEYKKHTWHKLKNLDL